MENPFKGIGFKALRSVQRGVKIPDRLWHYTPAQSAIGIIGSSKIWLTDAAFLNDGSELKWGLQVFDVVQKEISTDLPDDVNAEISRIRNEALRLLSFHGALVFCMCEEPNLLNQWRYYGRDIVPYSIGFDPVTLSELDQYNFNVQLIKMEYSTERQQKIIRRIIELIAEGLGEFGSLSDETATQYRKYAAYELLQAIFRFKNNAFEAEREWRLVTQYTEIMLKRVEINYRSNNLGIVPYVEMHKSDPNMKNLPIREIYIGPTPYPESSKLGLNSFLANKNYGYVKTFQSTIPIRQ